MKKTSKPKKLILLIGLSLASLGSCTFQHTVYQDRPLYLPARPALPVVDPVAAQVIPDDLWATIEERERLRRQYTEILEAIIGSTRPD